MWRRSRYLFWTCNSCGWKNDNLTLKDRIFICHECDLEEDRDLNAAKNIRDNGIKILTGSQELTSVEIGPPCRLETCEVRPFVEAEKRNSVTAERSLELHQGMPPFP